MLKSRAKNQEIGFTRLGNSQNMPIGNKLTNGDSVKLKYEHYEIEVCEIRIVNDDKISGVVDSILNNKIDEEVYEIDDILNILVGNEIEFEEINIFNCTRLS